MNYLCSLLIQVSSMAEGVHEGMLDAWLMMVVMQIGCELMKAKVKISFTKSKIVIHWN